LRELLEVSYDHHLLHLLSHWHSDLLIVKEICTFTWKKTVKLIDSTYKPNAYWLMDVISDQFRKISSV
jgi:hypothetical protein